MTDSRSTHPVSCVTYPLCILPMQSPWSDLQMLSTLIAAQTGKSHIMSASINAMLTWYVQALSTWITCDGIEVCRRGCGGHGYSLLSGLPTLYASYVQNATWEGDNNVLCLQVGMFSDSCRVKIL